jgi:hypothetical protein
VSHPNDGPALANAPGYLTYFQKNIEIHSLVPVFTVVWRAIEYKTIFSISAWKKARKS